MLTPTCPTADHVSESSRSFVVFVDGGRARLLFVQISHEVNEPEGFAAIFMETGHFRDGGGVDCVVGLLGLCKAEGSSDAQDAAYLRGMFVVITVLCK